MILASSVPGSRRVVPLIHIERALVGETMCGRRVRTDWNREVTAGDESKRITCPACLARVGKRKGEPCTSTM
jgi:hypothetical protein